MQSGSQCSNRAAGPAAVFALQQSRSPLARIAFNMQLAANGSQHHFARGQTLGSTGLSVQKKTHCTFARPRFVCGQESLVLSTCGQNERFLPAYALRGGPFRRFFAHREPFLPNTALLWPISREESFILSRGGQNERFFAAHERKRPLRPR